VGRHSSAGADPGRRHPGGAAGFAPFACGTPRALSLGMTLHIEHAAITHVGRRKNNEDNFCAEPQLGLFAVADGMGGYEGGEVASRLTVESLVQFFRREVADGECTWPFGLDRGLSLGENRLQVAVRLAHVEVAAKKTGPLSQMGSTVAALTISGGDAVIGHVGDSRVYRLRGGSLEQLTRDHSLWAELQAAGGVVPPREEFGYSNVITRAIGMESGARPDLRREVLWAGDVYLLCTDGLIEKLSDARIAELLARPTGEACRALVDEAYTSGGRDNITAVVVRVR
jgi:serine/threonine protein phosphatase PrpC